MIDARYEVERVLGRGGMSIVYAVRDRHSERRCALKQLATEQINHRAQLAAQFQREYAVLGQLTHPSIVTVYDYGVSDDCPYYTMELLESGDLHGLAPLAAAQVCKLLREVASALALLHSRRLLHRDATASNVRLDESGSAKLIDFGAMIHMGIPEQVIGTPPYIPPEAFHGQQLDGRVDLFALGALGYFLLTKRHAYPASSVHELRERWLTRPCAPSELVADVPKGLDELLLELLELDVGARPANAAEVMERLSALASLPTDRRLAVAQAYLATPALVGREAELARARHYLEYASRGQGALLSIEGEAGLGRSRLLASYSLEARLGGALAVRVSAKGQSASEFGVARAIVRQLYASAPDAVLESAHSRAALLGHMLPELHEALGQPELARAADRTRLASQLLAALLGWLSDLARTRYLAIAVDDADEADERSLSLLVELARAARSRRLLIAITARSGAAARSDRTFELLRAASVRVPLAPLTAAEVEALLRSLFGEVRNLTLVAGWVDGVAQGNPEAVMSLAQHLLDCDLARYEGGTWILPGSECQQMVPHSLRDAWSARISALSEHARTLAETLALILDPVDVDLLRDLRAPQLHAALDELVERQILVEAADRYSFAQAELSAMLRARADPEHERALHRKLADVYLAREQLLVAAHHLQHAGDDAAAASVALRWCEARRQGKYDDMLFWRSAATVAVLRRALAHADAHGCTPREAYELRRQLLQTSVGVDVPFADVAAWLLERLRTDSGIALLPADASLDPQQVARECLALAQARYDAAPEAERGLQPIEALRELATNTVMLSAAYGRSIDVEAMGTLLPLLAPFRGLGPLLELLYDITNAAVDRARGRRFSDHAASLFARLEAPVPGLDELTRHGARCILTYYLALEQAQLGSAAVLVHADFLEQDPAFEPLAWHVRMVKHLYSGEALRAEACRERTELLSLRNPETLNQLATSILYETEAQALSADFLALKTALPQVEQMAQRSAGWSLFQRTVRGEYEMLRGQHVLACEEFQYVLERARPGAHTAWSRTASSYTATLVAMGAHEQAIAFGEQACRDSAAARVNPLYIVLLRASVARAYAELGEHARGLLEIERVLADAEELGMTGVPLGCMYEAAARVALASGDMQRFEPALELVRKHYTSGGSEPVFAKYRRLMADAMRRWSAQEQRESQRVRTSPSVAEFSKQWTTGQSRDERAQLALSAVLAECAAEGGALFGTCPSGLQLMATSGVHSTAELERLADAQLGQALNASEQTGYARTVEVEVNQPVLLTAEQGERTLLVGVVVLAGLPAERPLPWLLLQAVGRALLDAEDVQPIVLPGG